MNLTQQDIDLIKAVADDLITNDKNGETTTLDIKEELRSSYPGRWIQQDISDAMRHLSDDLGLFIFDDTGDFRIYSHPVIVTQITVPDDNQVMVQPTQVIQNGVPRRSIVTRLRRLFSKE